MTRNNLIFKINQAVRSVEDRSGLCDLDLTSKEILRFVGESEAGKRRINVTEIVRHGEFGSPPTIFSRLSLLEQQQWIALIPDESDGRVKNVQLSARARKAFTLMSSAALKTMTEAQ
jgi:DNA-binding MarR family transcriptional regulator